MHRRQYKFGPTKPLGGWLGSDSDEERGKQRYALGRCKQPLIQGFLNETSYPSGWLVIIAYAGNWSVLVPAGKEINRDAVIISERKQHRANWILCRNAKGDVVLQDLFLVLLFLAEASGKLHHRGWESRRLKIKNVQVSWVESVGNQAWIWEALTSNPKYLSESDSVQVQWWKVEKNSWKRVKSAWNLMVIACYGSKELWRTFRTTGQGVHLSGENKATKAVFKGKPIVRSFGEEQCMKMHLVAWVLPETGWSNPGQGEVGVKPYGGLQRFCVQALFWSGIRGERPIEPSDSWFLLKWAAVQYPGR